MRLRYIAYAGIVLVQFHPLIPKHYEPQPGAVAPYANPSSLPTLGGDVRGPIGANTVAALHGQNFPTPTGSPGNALMVNASGTIVWTATPSPAPTPTPGPTPDIAPTAIAGLPSCVPGLLGRYAQVTDQNCGSVTFGATPVSTAGTGCQEPVFCGGAATGTPTPAWRID